MVSSTPNIPDEGYFGISAATGGLSDDHDVMSFIVHSLHPLDEEKEVEFYYMEGNFWWEFNLNIFLPLISSLWYRGAIMWCVFIRMFYRVEGNRR